VCENGGNFFLQNIEHLIILNTLSSRQNSWNCHEREISVSFSSVKGKEEQREENKRVEEKAEKRKMIGMSKKRKRGHVGGIR
jgi:hypothetical protein